MRFDPSFWRKCRVTFRWCRITVWLVVLVLLSAGIWLNRIGLPDFLKARLVTAAHDRGIDLEFARMRLRFVRGIVADQVRIGVSDTTNRPSLTVAEVQLQLNLPALLHRQLQLSGLILNHGTLTAPVLPPHGAARQLELDDINVRLHFQTNDVWTLDHFSAVFAGTQISVSSQIAHASELRNLGIFQTKTTGAAGIVQQELNELSEITENVHFIGTPNINLSVNGDARDLRTFDLQLHAHVPAASSPWATVKNATLNAGADSADSNSLPRLTLDLSADIAATRWADLNHATLLIQTQTSPPTQMPPATIRLRAAAASSRWGSARDIRIDADATPCANAPKVFDAGLAWWTNAQPYQLGWSVSLSDLRTSQADASSLAIGGFWTSPELAITNLSATLGGGRLVAQAKLDVVSRQLTFTNRSDFDIHVLDRLLTEKTRDRLSEFAWTLPPVLSGTGSLVLPAWTDPQPDWRTQVQPTLQLDGSLALTNATVLGAHIDAARARFTYAGLVWNVSSAELEQGNTSLALSGTEDDHTRAYQWNVRGRFDPETARSLIQSEKVRRGFDYVTFTQPITLDVNVSGTLYDFTTFSAEGKLAAAHFAVRNQSVDQVTANLFYTNRVLEFHQPVLWRANGAQTMTADLVALDFNRKLILFTNGFSTADPVVVGNAIGPITARTLAPYHFLSPPTARVNGQLPLRNFNHGRDLAGTDMHFEIIKGAPFRWSKLYATNVIGSIRWQGQTLSLNQVTANLYGGTGTGYASFDFRPVEHDCDYSFGFVLHDVDLRLIAENASFKTNHLEGMLNASVIVTNASSADWHSWNGDGAASLRDGVLWDVPLFGILSPALNTVSPGLGSSRATEAEGKFTITNGVIYTDSLSIGLPLSRLQFVGTVDLKQNLNARVTAQPLRNTPVIGSVASTLLWPVGKLFEYRVTGTLRDPKTTPVFVPTKVLMFPLHPIRSLEDIFPGGGNSYFGE
jgi:hypothetical protein